MTQRARKRWWMIPLGACLGAILGCGVSAVVLWWWPGIHEPRHQEGVWVFGENPPPTVDLDRELMLDRFRAERVAEKLIPNRWPDMSREDLLEHAMQSVRIRLIEDGKSCEFRFKGETREQVQDLYKETMGLYRGWDLWVAEEKLADEDRGLHDRLSEANHQVTLAQNQLREFARQAETDPLKARILELLRDKQEPPADDMALRDEIRKLAVTDRALGEAIRTRDELTARLGVLDLPPAGLLLPTGEARIFERASNVWSVMAAGASAGLLAGAVLGLIGARRRCRETSRSGLDRAE